MARRGLKDLFATAQSVARDVVIVHEPSGGVVVVVVVVVVVADASSMILTTTPPLASSVGGVSKKGTPDKTSFRLGDPEGGGLEATAERRRRTSSAVVIQSVESDRKRYLLESSGKIQAKRYNPILLVVMNRR
jgi:hypothetical protein